jgi:hypothetical protein
MRSRAWRQPCNPAVSDPQPEPAKWEPVEFVCNECGALVSIRDPVALIRALHLARDCTVSGLVAPQP